VSRRTYLRRRILVFGGLGAFLLAALYLPMTLLAPLPPASAQSVATVVPENPPVDLSWPAFGSSAVGAVGFSGVLASNGPTTPRPIASISKIVTSLVVLEEKPLADASAGPTITMTAADTALYRSYLARNGEVRSVWPGLTLTERQLLEVVLVASANNYAESMAVWAFGSVPKFLDATRDWLDRNGLHDTTITEPTGMSPANTSTTEDLLELAKIALAHPVVSDIVGSQTVTLPHFGTVTNTNELLGVDGIVGIKTGTLPEAGACLLFASTIDVDGTPVTIVGVLLGGPDHPTIDVAIRALLASATGGFRQIQVVTAGEVFYTYSTPWEQSARAVATHDVSALVWAGMPITTHARASEVRDGEPGDQVGSITVNVEDSTQVVSLDLDSTIADPGPWWRLTHPFG